MFTWYKVCEYYRLWAYLYINCYCPEQWKLWARAADPAEIPAVKTTMIVESHWRKRPKAYNEVPEKASKDWGFCVQVKQIHS
jgi:hypothetical protein